MSRKPGVEQEDGDLLVFIKRYVSWFLKKEEGERETSM